MSLSRVLITVILILIVYCNSVPAEQNVNNAVPIGFDGPLIPEGEDPDYPTIYPTDFPTELPTITIEPTIGDQYGWISINTIPSGAWVTFDGDAQGQSPVMVQVLSTASPFHQIYISMDGYQDWSTSLSENPAPGQTIPINAHLVRMEPTVTPTFTPTVTPTESPTPSPTPTIIGPDYGWVYIESNPTAAEVTFDGVYQGSAPALVKVYSTGTPSHQILIRMSGYYDWTSALSQNPGPDQTIPITATLVPMAQYGSIRVQSNPTRSVAILDGGNQDLTPCTFDNLLPGSHTIKVTKDGYQPYTTQVRVNTGTEVQVSASLSPVNRFGTLYVTSTPSGADIFLDGVYYGQTPYTLSASAGAHTLVLKYAGYNTFSSGVTLYAGQQNQITAQLEPHGPSYGSVQVASTPGSSEVFLNNDYKGKTPSTGYLDIPGLNPGIYTIRISHPQNQDYQGTVSVNGGQTSTVQVALQSSPNPATKNGTLVVNTNPSGAYVFLDNLFKGITPLTLPSVQPGQHTLIVRMNDYSDATRPVTITGGNTTDMIIEMVPIAQPTKEPTQTPLPTQTRAPVPLLAIIGGLCAAGFLFHRRNN